MLLKFWKFKQSIGKQRDKLGEKMKSTKDNINAPFH
jgi:hypothetical protein